MATIGERYDSIMIQIEKAETAQSYQTSSGEQLSRGTLFRLYEERDRILDKITTYGSNYEDGHNITPMGDTSLVSFV